MMIILSKLSQFLKDKQHMFSLICESFALQLIIWKEEGNDLGNKKEIMRERQRESGHWKGLEKMCSKYILFLHKNGLI